MPGKIKNGRSAAADTVTYFFLMTHNAQGAQQTAKVKQQAIADVTKAVSDEGGKCALFVTKGGPYDYVSVMSGISAAGAIRLANFIEGRGTVKTKVLPGLLQLGEL